MSYLRRNPDDEMSFEPLDLRSPTQVSISASGQYSIPPRSVGPNESLYTLLAGRCYNKATGKQAAVTNCPGGAVAAAVTKVTGGGMPKWALPVAGLALIGGIYFLMRSRRAIPVKNPSKKKRRVRCSFCGQLVPIATAHRHKGAWVGDECCWDERLRASE